MDAKKRNIIDLIFNLAIFLSTAVAVGYYFVGGPDILGSRGSGCFKYFTTDSNVLAALGALVMLFYNVKKLRAPETATPKWAAIFKFVGAVSVTITFLTVVLFLVPVSCAKGGLRSFFFYFEGNVFALHFSTPVLAALSVMFFERDAALTERDALWALAPTVVYSIVYAVMVIYVGKWTDWYGFTFGGHSRLAPVSMVGMYLVTYGVAAAERRIRAGKAGKPCDAADIA